jgi:hypothetical protein
LVPFVKPFDKPRESGSRAYAALNRFARTFVTTNYDDLLDIGVPALPPAVSQTDGAATAPPPARRIVLSKVEQFTYAALNQGDTVFHIHGSMTDPGGMVLTTSDYLARYANHSMNSGSYKENEYLTFLQMLFDSKNVLFVGYGLNELEVLEYVIHKAGTRAQDLLARGVAAEAPRHFLLLGFYSHELELMKSLKRYYASECGVELMPFCRDERDWDQLVDVLEHLAQQLPVGALLNLQKRAELRGLLE